MNSRSWVMHMNSWIMNSWMNSMKSWVMMNSLNEYYEQFDYMHIYGC